MKLPEHPLEPSSVAPAPEPALEPLPQETLRGHVRNAAMARFALRAVLLLVGFALVAHSFRAFVTVLVTYAATLGVLVFVHEWGHFQFARWGGMKVNRFGIGFPPWVYTIRRNNIDYSIGALPLGGMVDIAGLGSEEEMVHTAQGEQVARKRNPHAPHGEKNFEDAKLSWRFWTLFAGPMMNFIFAIILFIGLFSVMGVPTDAVLSPLVDSVQAGAPADKGGVKGGDLIVAADGRAITTFNEVSEYIHKSTAPAIILTVERAGKRISLTVKPVKRDIAGDGHLVRSIGVQFDPNNFVKLIYTKVTPIEAVQAGLQQSRDQILGMLDMIRRAFMWRLTQNEVKHIGGPVKIAQTVGQVVQHGPSMVLRLAATLSVNLGLLNLLPIPALDGGRILFLGYELVARKPFDPRKEGLVHAAGMIFLLAFMLLITLHDVSTLPGAAAFHKMVGW